MQSEQDLVHRAQQGDNEAYAQLYENNFDRIYRYIVLKIGNEAEAEDMTQQVFLNSLKSIRSFKRKGISFSAWLFRIAHNLVVDYFRKTSKVITTSLTDSLPDNSGNPQQIIEHQLDIEWNVPSRQQRPQHQHRHQSVLEG